MDDHKSEGDRDYLGTNAVHDGFQLGLQTHDLGILWIIGFVLIMQAFMSGQNPNRRDGGIITGSSDILATSRFVLVRGSSIFIRLWTERN